jgi:PAS domain S-box-containing protein
MSDETSAEFEAARAGSTGLDVLQQQLRAREREMLFGALAESLPLLVWVAAPSGERLYSNHYYTDYTGFDAAQLQGSGWMVLVHPDDLARTNTLWQRSMTTGEPYMNELRLRRGDGAYRTFLARAVPMLDAQGRIERWLGSATDIHDQKLAEEAVRRTEKLAAAGRLAATIAHEINNPLAAVMNALYLAMLDETLSPTTREYLRIAEQELTRAAHVTTQTLQFHRHTTMPAMADLAEVMDSAIALFATRFRSAQIELTCEYDTQTLLHCCGDELRQVFANLLSNALDAMRQGGRVRVRVCDAHAWDEARRPGLKVVIADTGSGIPKHVMARVYEPFLSTKETTGTGLGLWVTENIVRKHGGRIQLRSRSQEDAPAGVATGTVFRLLFPLDGMPR